MKLLTFQLTTLGGRLMLSLLISVLLIQSSTQQQQKDIFLYKWVETSANQWPPADSGNSATPDEQFLIYHSEYSIDALFRLRESLYGDQGFSGKLDLSFKYWAIGEGSFSTRSSSTAERNIKLLERGDKWNSVNLSNLSKEEWENFSLFSRQEFTIALKDVRVSRGTSSAHWTFAVCNMSTGCDNIFDRRLPTSTLVPTPNSSRRFVPFPGAKGNSRPYLSYNKPLDKFDLCIDFSYVAKSVPLVVSLKKERESLEISFPTTPKVHNNYLAQSRTVCASWLSHDVSAVDGLYFRFNTDSPIYDLDNHYVSDPKHRLIDFVPKISEGIYANTLDLTTGRSQFNTHTNATGDGWSTDAKTNGNLIFTKTLEQLKNLQPNAQGAHGQYHECSLRTKWFQVPMYEKSLEHIQVGYENKLKNAQLFYSFNFRLISSTTTIWTLNILNEKPKNLMVSRLPHVRNSNFHYQLEIVVQLNVTKIGELTATGRLTGPLELVLENFSVNDPCVGEKNGLETCSNNEKDSRTSGFNGTLNKSHCLRNYDNFTAICECSSNFKGDHCQYEVNSVITPTVPKSTVPATTTTTSNSAKDPTVALASETIAKAEKDLKEDEIGQAQILAQVNKLGADEQLIGEMEA